MDRIVREIYLQKQIDSRKHWAGNRERYKEYIKYIKYKIKAEQI